MLLVPLIAHDAELPGAVLNPKDVAASTYVECKPAALPELLVNPLKGS